MKEKQKLIYVCSECGEISPRWMGRCPGCGAWNTMQQDVSVSSSSASAPNVSGNSIELDGYNLSEVVVEENDSRILTGIGELDRVLGGGIVPGAVILLGGEPGAGKSTLLLQLCGCLSSQNKVLYITGEESVLQVKLRADRLNILQENIVIAAGNDIDSVCALIESKKPIIAVVDSIQTMHCSDVNSSMGSVSQVKECSTRLMHLAKKIGIPIFIVGHVNKDGAIAGPKVMEHIVDTVLYFEGDKTLPYRILRAAKNRYGSTNEIGMFDMFASGLKEIENPSATLLEGRPLGVSGNCVCSIMEGTRSILCEVQALVTKSNLSVSRRTTSGVDYNRVTLLLAVLEKRAGFYFGNMDVYLNVIGGLQITETACDLSICAALISALLDKPIDDRMIAIGEIGLSGEIRNVNSMEQRLVEAERIGFKKALIPSITLKSLDLSRFSEMKIVGVKYITDIIKNI